MHGLAIAAIGLLGGLTSGLFGVGGGVIFVPLLILFASMNIHQAIGTSLAVIVPTALLAVLRNVPAGSIDWKTVGVLALFAGLGAWLGAGLSLKFDTMVLRKIFALFLFLMALRLFFWKS